MSFHMAFVLILLSYLLVTALYLLRLVWNKPIIAALALRWCLLTVFLQSLLLIGHFVTKPAPLFASYFDYYQLSACILAWIFVGLCFAKRFYAAGPLFVTLVDVFCILSLTHENPYSFTNTMPGSVFLFFHLSSIFLSLTFFVVGLVSAILFLLSNDQIKHKRFDGWMAKLPSLSEIEDVHYQAIKFGFMLFTLSILMGAGYAKMNTGYYISSDIKQVLSYVTWIFFAIVLNLRVRLGWQGQKGVVLSLVGFFSLICLALVGLK